MRTEEKAILQSFFIPGIFLLMMWMLKLTEWFFDLSFVTYGIHPLHADGLPGIFLSPFIHGDWQHLAANSVPVLVLGAALFYFYKPLAYKVLLLIIVLSGLWVWAGARGSYHIGASGVIYGLSSFLLVSGFIRNEARLMALSLIVVFLYGSFVWGIFPDFFPEKNISWEGHLSGMLAGLILAIFYRKHGPQKSRYSWEHEDENENMDETGKDPAEEKPYWDVPEPDQKDLTIVYKFRQKSGDN